MPIGSKPDTPGSCCASCIRHTVDNLERLVEDLDKKDNINLPRKRSIFSEPKDKLLDESENLISHTATNGPN